MFGRKRKVRRNVYKAGVRKRRQNRIARIRKAALALGGLSLFLVFNLVLILAHDWVTQTTILPIATVQVEGAQRLNERDVHRRAGIAMDDNILAVNLGTARRRLQAHPWIAEARVRREIPSRIVIRIREHDCAAVLNLNRQFLISSAGVVFKERQNDECEGAPLISGIDYVDLGLDGNSPSAALEAALILVNRTGGWTDLGGRFKIHEIRADPELGLTLFVAPPGNHPAYRTVMLGFANWPHKSRKLAAIQSYLKKHRLMPDARIFNLRDPDRIVISPEAPAATAAPTKEV
jgi:cell division protein FtsQ